MAQASSVEITQLLRAWSRGDPGAIERLTPAIYDELRRIARKYMAKEYLGRFLEPTELVHEAYLRLVDVACVEWQGRAHFFAVSAQIMRHILVDSARARRSAKRGAGLRVTLDPDLVASPARNPELLDLDAAIEALSRIDSRKARVIEMRVFGGLSVEEAAEVLQISPQSVQRDWKLGKAWLMREMSKGVG